MLRAGRVAAAVVLGAAAVILLPSSALGSPSSRPGGPAPGAVRLWGVWRSDGTAWLASTAAYEPADGSVVGWRFAVSADGSVGEPPGGELPSFPAVCVQDAAGSGHKRVAVAVDFGDGEGDVPPGDRPPAHPLLRCVTGAEDATAAQLLASAARVGVNGRGEVVSVSGYPSQGVGAVPSQGVGSVPSQGGTASSREAGAAERAAGPAGAPGGVPALLIAGGAGVLLLLAGGTALAARRRTG
ncbi:SCO2322 family protein [Nonomuraea sp. NPDC049684]|uniref:SCO2322 family protein n=1 Tax=Nonomuraea sp. NPDC049684 TaxID=3364356 RepID=UPI00379490BB